MVIPKELRRKPVPSEQHYRKNNLPEERRVEVCLVAAEHNIRPLDEMEEEAIRHALRVFKGNVPNAAHALNIGRATLYRRVKKWAENGTLNDA